MNDDRETKISKLITDLEYEKHDKLHDIIVIESKPIKLEIPPAQVDKSKESVLPT